MIESNGDRVIGIIGVIAIFSLLLIVAKVAFPGFLENVMTTMNKWLTDIANPVTTPPGL